MGGIGGRRRRGRQRMRRLDGITDSMDWVNSEVKSEWTLEVGDGQGGLMCAIHGLAKSRTRLSDWTELNWMWKSPGIESQWVKWKSLSRGWLCDHGLYTPWNSPGQNAGVSSISLLQRIFPTQGSNPGLLHCRQMPYQLSHKGSPVTTP